jgi:hypothetical protein
MRCPARPLRAALVADHDVSRSIDHDAWGAVFIPEIEFKRRDLAQRAANRFHRGSGDLTAIGVLLGLPQPVDGPQGHQIAVGPQLYALRRDARERTSLFDQ